MRASDGAQADRAILVALPTPVRVVMRLVMQVAAALALLACACVAVTRPALADPDCQDGSVLSARILTNVCWDCVFPIRVAGVNFGTAPSPPPSPGTGAGSSQSSGSATGSSTATGSNPAFTGTSGSGSVPAGAADQPLCLCTDAGVPHPGVTVGMWMPFQIIETVRKPGCSLTMGGLTLPGADPLHDGTKGRSEGENGDGSFLHYHSYSFPVFKMLELFSDAHCFSGALADFDILFLSEIDPTWTYDELAFFTAPESAAVALPPAQLACLGDAVAALGGGGFDSLFWCAGSWGAIYPMSGNANGQRSSVSDMSLLGARALAVQHRRGLAVRTMGDDVLCQGAYDTLMPKSQYRFSMFWPVPEANGDHVIGQTTLVWGDWRQFPATGEDASFIIFRWQDCCLELM